MAANDPNTAAELRKLIQSDAALEQIREILSGISNSQDIGNEVDSTGWTLLHEAIAKNRLDVIQEFFDMKLYTDRHMIPEQLPYLHMACALGFMDVVDVILRNLPFSIRCIVSS